MIFGPFFIVDCSDSKLVGAAAAAVAAVAASTSNISSAARSSLKIEFAEINHSRQDSLSS